MKEVCYSPFSPSAFSPPCPLSPPPTMMCDLDDSLASDSFLNASDWGHLLDITHSFRIFSNLHTNCENELTLPLPSLQGPLSGMVLLLSG